MTLSTKTIQSLLLATLLFVFNSAIWAKDSITVSNAWIADAPPTSKMHAGYLTIKNSAEDEIELESVSSSKFKIIEIHRTQVINKIARMVEQDGLPIFGKETTTFAPGGLHLMMMGATGPLKTGDKIKLTLKFENNLTKTIIAKVKKRISK